MVVKLPLRPRVKTPQASSLRLASSVRLHEIFLSIQGEGELSGRGQLFLRLAGCPLRCRWCDSPDTWHAQATWHLHHRGSTETRSNPVSETELSSALQDLAQEYSLDAATWTLALTGGEPLVQHEFLASWLPQWDGPVLLETAGIWPQRLATLIPYLAAVSLDWKLPSALDQGHALSAPADCVALCRDAGVDSWVKVVVDAQTGDLELDEALRDLASLAPGMSVFLQPATPIPGVAAPPEDFLLAALLRHRQTDLDLRVRPQIHPLLGVL